MQTLIQTAVSGSGRVQILNLNCDFGIVIPMFSFKTLVSLKLEYIFVEHISFFDLPLLKILHLKHVSPIEDDLSQLLSGCPNLEELNVKDLGCETTEKFIKLPKLVRVRIDEPFLPLEIFKDVEVLKFDWVMPIFPFPPNLNFDFHNLVQLQLIVDLDWLVVLKTLNHCPKFQTLVISMEKV
ncbi:hypothetical protein V8G54_011558 [Vigna mungo]|uniref:F-box/LRR-repeat protein 15/At3g58940/PEG3-like LRR domain-containing protein n=1 Tax=Vigna mungo TaxID=3915 RepID=A0AAQ3NRU8_VIGMU